MNALTVKSRSWWKYEWDILRDSTKIGEMVSTKAMSLSHVQARAEGHEWTLGKSSWITSDIYVKDASGADIGEAHGTSWWKSDVVVTLQGKKYTIKPGNWYWTKFVVRDESDREILTVQMRWWKVAAEVHVTNYVVDNPTIYLLAMITFLRAKITEEQSAAASAGSVAVVSSSS